MPAGAGRQVGRLVVGRAARDDQLCKGAWNVPRSERKLEKWILVPLQHLSAGISSSFGSGCRTRVHVQLFEDSLEVPLDGVGGDHQSLGNFLVR